LRKREYLTFLEKSSVKSGDAGVEGEKEDEDNGGVGEPLVGDEDEDIDRNNRNRRRNALLVEAERIRLQYLIRPIRLQGDQEE